MMKNLIICESERFGNIRVLVENGTPLLCGSDVTGDSWLSELAESSGTNQRHPSEASLAH